MKVPVKKITSRGFSFERDLAANDWNLDGFDVKFINLIKLNGFLKKDYGEVKSWVDVVTYRKINCSRCLIEACQIREYNFKKNYRLNDLGDFLDIGEGLREEILLNFPFRVLCSDGCQGLCPECGSNLNWRKCNC